ncbi:Crp/Fnr family transcriptional regulator [Aquimarina sp. AU474]|uniref:Crp/Fnr family transcriptional regulator n=1 Tax=Aquimarina sp. AU474 TaxID=2108529 RepID=UPI000D68D4C4|nr:Crp/Fnr family transcriptional regulator [Aquimarina sp. AU474]
MIDTLKNHILKFVSPPKSELQEFLNKMQLKRYNNKEYLLKEQQYCTHQYFISKGCFRFYFINQKGIEKIINFGIEDWWISNFDSFINKSPSEYNIQAVEDAVVFKINKQDLSAILANSLELNQYFRMIHERVRIADQKRIQYMYSLSGEELYTTFREYNPHFVQRVPQYMLASYLGFTPEFLSKIRANKKV